MSVKKEYNLPEGRKNIRRENCERALVLFFFFLFLLMNYVLPVRAQELTEEQLWKKGNAFCLQAKWREAVQSFNSLLNKYPKTKHVEARFWIGFSNVELGKYGTGIKQMREFAVKYPNNPYTPQALYIVGEVYETRLKQYDRALAAYNEVINRYPQNIFSVPAAQNQAVIYERRKKDYKKAEKALTRSKQMATAQRMTPGNVYLTRANRRIRFIRENSDYGYKPLSLYTDGVNKEEDKKWDKASSIYKKLIDKYPDSNVADDALFRRINCLMKMRKYREVTNESEEFLKSYPRSPYMPKIRAILEEAKKRGSIRLELYFV